MSFLFVKQGISWEQSSGESLICKWSNFLQVDLRLVFCFVKKHTSGRQSSDESIGNEQMSGKQISDEFPIA